MFTAFLRKLPYPVASLMLGLAALGNLVAPYGMHFRYAAGATAAIIFLLVLAKALRFPASLSEALSHVVVCSVLPSFSMGTAILAGYLRPWFPAAAELLWFAALALHLTLLAIFTRRYVFDFKIKLVFPSWFIVYVGLAAFSVTGPAFGYTALGQALFWVAGASYFLLLPVVLYRLIVAREVPPPALPTLAIFAAPSSLALAGYFSSFKDRNLTLVYVLAACTVLSFVFVLSRLPSLLRLPFFPSYSAFTFPFVITAIALKGTSAFLNTANRGVPLLARSVPFLELWAIVAVIYVLVRYLHFLAFTGPSPSPQTQASK